MSLTTSLVPFSKLLATAYVEALKRFVEALKIQEWGITGVIYVIKLEIILTLC